MWSRALTSGLVATLACAVSAQGGKKGPPGNVPEGVIATGPWAGASAAPLLGDVGFTTVGGVQGPKTFVAGENIYGPFEAGFDSAQKDILEGLGCTDASKGYVQGGIDTYTAEQMVAESCDVTLPRTEGDKYIGLLDQCGGHTREYHFHESFSCLYDEDKPGHSPQIGKAADTNETPIYGKWEDRDGLAIPALDACNGHFGTTPESDGNIVYHHHVAGLPPFSIGCYGPAKGDQGTGLVSVPGQKLVSTDECRALYPGCGDGDVISVKTKAGTFDYDPWCPCYSGYSNVPASPPRSASPSPPPSASPSPPPKEDDVPWKNCDSMQMTGDIDKSGAATLGDAVHVANMRLEYGTTLKNPMEGDCMDGDFDMDGRFTVNDASHVALAQFGRAHLPWNQPQGGRRQLDSEPTVTNAHAGMYAVKSQSAALQMDVHVASPSPTATWKGLSVQFNGGKIVSVEMKADHINALKAPNSLFFMAADLGGTGFSWPMGHAATVTFEAGTDMDAVSIDYGSMNTYVVQNADPACQPSATSMCASVITRNPVPGAMEPPKKPKAEPVAEPEAPKTSAEESRAPKPSFQPSQAEAELSMWGADMATVAIASGGLLSVLALLTAATCVFGRRGSTTPTAAMEIKEVSVNK